MRELLDLDRYPLDRPQSPEYGDLVATCRDAMHQEGMFNLDGFVRPEAVAKAAGEVLPRSTRESYTHQRSHNVYFDDRAPGVPVGHAALKRFDTINHTLCNDQLEGTVVRQIYEWEPLPAFLAQVLGKPKLYLMADPLARINVMEYREDEALNWHFDRSLFTTTLLIQAAQHGGEFQYRSGLRSDADPNYAGVAEALEGRDAGIKINPLSAGTLNVFAGKNTLHRVSTVGGSQSRIVAVYSYYERPDVMFSDAERRGFYGRAN